MTAIEAISAHNGGSVRVTEALFCRDPRFGLSHVSWRTTVADHPTEDRAVVLPWYCAECRRDLVQLSCRSIRARLRQLVVLAGLVPI